MSDKTQKAGHFYGIGIGPGDPELITVKASRVLTEVPVVFLVPDRTAESSGYLHSIVADLIRSDQNVGELTFTNITDQGELAHQYQKAADSIWSHLERGEDCALVGLGDLLVYGPSAFVIESLRREHPAVEMEVIPGISSINAAAARALVPLALLDERIAIITGRSDDDFIKETLHSFDTVVFMKVNRVFDRILGILEELNLVGQCVYIKRCTTRDEEIITDVRKLRGQELDHFSLLIVRK